MAMKRIFLHVPCSDDVQECTCSFLKNRGLRETCATHCYITNVDASEGAESVDEARSPAD